MNPEDVHSYLDSFINYEHHLKDVKRHSFNLERMRGLLDALGNPQKNLKIVHVAGSKGKGSVCVMTASILKTASFKVGLYTSPHINSYRERIRVLNGKMNNTEDIFCDAITDEDLCTILDEIKPQIENVRAQENFGVLSFYEVYTAMALFHFSKEQTDVVILETGLGGRLDATNVVNSLCCAITPISLEHTQLLGKTVAEIAKEKAAIIKSPGQRVVIAKQESDVLDVIDARCREFDIIHNYEVLDPETKVVSRELTEQVVDIKVGRNKYRNLRLSLVGDHQLVNAKVAIGIVDALRELKFKIRLMSIYDGLSNVSWPIRFEYIDDHNMILDGAHNGDSMRSLVNTFMQLFPGKKGTVIFGVSDDKNIEEMADELIKIADKVILTKANHPRAYQWSKEGKKYFQDVDVIESATVEEAFECAKQSNEMIVVTGSLFVASEARACTSLRV